MVLAFHDPSWHLRSVPPVTTSVVDAGVREPIIFTSRSFHNRMQGAQIGSACTAALDIGIARVSTDFATVYTVHLRILTTLK